MHQNEKVVRLCNQKHAEIKRTNRLRFCCTHNNLVGIDVTRKKEAALSHLQPWGKGRRAVQQIQHVLDTEKKKKTFRQG